MQAELVSLNSLAVVVKSFKEIKGDGIAASRVGNIKVELNVLRVDVTTTHRLSEAIHIVD